jgi:hypothetical protein
MPPGIFATAPNRIRHFRSFAKTQANATLFISDHYKCAELKTASAFDNLGGTVDENDFLDEIFAALIVKTLGGVRPTTPTTTTATPLAAAPAAAPLAAAKTAKAASATASAGSSRCAFS